MHTYAYKLTVISGSSIENTTTYSRMAMHRISEGGVDPEHRCSAAVVDEDFT